MKNNDQFPNYEEKMKIAKSRAELANELGIEIPKDGYWGDVPSRLCGIVGGAIGGPKTKNMVEKFEQGLVKKEQ